MATDPKEEKVTQEEQKASQENVEQNASTEENPTEQESAYEDASGENTAEEPKEELEGKEATKQLKTELGEFKDKYLRLYSEFDNYRKRTAKEKADFLKSANKDLILELLPVLDDLQRADKAFDPEKANIEQLKEGYDLVFQKFHKALQKNGLQVIAVKKGDTFDVEQHEAVTQFPAPSDDLKGKVIDEVEKGYKLGDKVIRFSKVVVGA